MKQPRNTVITGIKALYLQGVISFNPEFVDIAFKSGSNLRYYKEKFPAYKPFTQIPELLKIGIEQIGERTLFTKERLLVDIHKFNIDELLKKEALRNLYRECDPAKVYLIVKEFKGISRISPSEESIHFLKIKKDVFLDNQIANDEIEQHLREMVMNRLYESGISCLVKGGSAVEVSIAQKRGTKDVDMYSSTKEMTTLIEVLSKQKDHIFFKVNDFNKKNFSNIEEKKHARVELLARSSEAYYASKVKNQTLILDISFDLSEEDYSWALKEFKLKPRKLWKLQRMYMPISDDMLLGEKVMAALDSQTKKIWRAKDMMDIFNLSKKDINISLAQKWFAKKISISNRTKEEYMGFLNVLKNNEEEYKNKLAATLNTYNAKDFDYEITLKVIESIIL